MCGSCTVSGPPALSWDSAGVKCGLCDGWSEVSPRTCCVGCGSRATDKKRVGLSNHEGAVALIEMPGYAVEAVREGTCGLAGLKLLSCSIPHCRFPRAARIGISPVRMALSFLMQGNVRAGMPADVVGRCMADSCALRQRNAAAQPVDGDGRQCRPASSCDAMPTGRARKRRSLTEQGKGGSPGECHCTPSVRCDKWPVFRRGVVYNPRGASCVSCPE